MFFVPFHFRVLKYSAFYFVVCIFPGVLLSFQPSLLRYYQRWVEAATSHYAARRLRERTGKDAGGQTWWDRTASALYGNGISFEQRMQGVCDPVRLALYKPAVVAMCEQLMLPSGGNLNTELVSMYGGPPDMFHPGAKTPGKRMGLVRVPGIKWHVCTQASTHCTEDVHFKAKKLLTDRCGMCRMLAADLLFLVRRGDPGNDMEAFLASTVTDTCLVSGLPPCVCVCVCVCLCLCLCLRLSYTQFLRVPSQLLLLPPSAAGCWLLLLLPSTSQSLELRHPRGQHTRLMDICLSIVDKHEPELVQLLLHHARQGAASTEDAFVDDMCGADAAGLC